MERTGGGTLSPVLGLGSGGDRMPLPWASSLASWRRLHLRQGKGDHGREEQEQRGMCGLTPPERAGSWRELLHLLLVVFQLFVPLDRGTKYTL